MLNTKNKKSLSLNKETISVLDEAKMDNVKGGTTPGCWAVAALTTNLIAQAHDYGDNQSWWHCGDTSADCPSEELGC